MAISVLFKYMMWYLFEIWTFDILGDLYSLALYVPSVFAAICKAHKSCNRVWKRGLAATRSPFYEWRGGWGGWPSRTLGGEVPTLAQCKIVCNDKIHTGKVWFTDLNVTSIKCPSARWVVYSPPTAYFSSMGSGHWHYWQRELRAFSYSLPLAAVTIFKEMIVMKKTCMTRRKFMGFWTGILLLYD